MLRKSGKTFRLQNNPLINEVNFETRDPVESGDRGRNFAGQERSKTFKTRWMICKLATRSLLLRQQHYGKYVCSRGFDLTPTLPRLREESEAGDLRRGMCESGFESRSGSKQHKELYAV
jgi:hypothetical protein